MTQNGQFCMAKIKYTLIQGNFYERLLFYMDSCALSPMASLFLAQQLAQQCLCNQSSVNLTSKSGNLDNWDFGWMDCWTVVNFGQLANLTITILNKRLPR